jgi:hypothetical protein
MGAIMRNSLEKKPQDPSRIPSVGRGSMPAQRILPKCIGEGFIIFVQPNAKKNSRKTPKPI